jgi:hypothetical protein
MPNTSAAARSDQSSQSRVGEIDKAVAREVSNLIQSRRLGGDIAAVRQRIVSLEDQRRALIG